MPRQAIGGSRRHVMLSKPQEQRLVALSKKTGHTTSELIRRALDSYFRTLELAELRVKK